MKISVIIPSYNEEKNIERCLKSICAQEGLDDYEIILVDGGSTDRTVEIAEPYVAKVLSDDSNGPGFARNLGVKECKGEIVVFTDADTEVPPGWLKEYGRAFQNPKVVGAGGPLNIRKGRLIDKIAFKFNSDWFYRMTAWVHFYQLSGNNCGYRKDVFLEEGGFNEKLTMLEDTELSLRMAKRGKIVFDKNIYVYTSPRRFQKKGYWAVGFKYFRAYWRLFVVHKPVTFKYFRSAEVKR
jgi:glycosyltransferase involved in cell wall biosynthesis